MSNHLMSSRRFAPLFWCQFVSALNDNFLKNALVMVVIFKIGAEQGELYAALAGAALIIPYLLLSAIAGEMADKYDKADVARTLKLCEIPVSLLAALGFALGSVPLMFLALALFGVIAALFGPIKYGILPDHLAQRELPAANALIEGATFLAILGGTIAGGLAADERVPESLVALVIVAMGIAGYVSAKLIPPTGRAAPDLVLSFDPIGSTRALLADLAADRRLWIGGLITSWFWFAGFVALTLLPPLVKTHLGGTSSVATAGLVLFTVGIALGSALAARMSRLRPNLALVPIGGLLMALFAAEIAWVISRHAAPTTTLGIADLAVTADGIRLAIGLVGLSAAGGLFIVPSFAAVQGWAPADRRARVVAAVNVLNAAFMTAAALLVMLASVAGIGAAACFALLAVANVAVAVLVLRAWGRDGVQDLAAFVFRLFYRLEVRGLEHLPKPGERAIITPNHVSFMDGPVMHALMPSHAAFAIDTGIAQAWWVKPFLKLINAHTIDPTRPLAARALIESVKGGETLVIFPEGRITVTGGLMKVYDGTAMIADKADAVVVPVRIDGFERSGWSYLSRGQIRKALFPKVEVTILPPRKLNVDPALRGKVRRQAAGALLQDIMIDCAVETAKLDRTLFQALVAARESRDTGKPIIQDPLMAKLSYRKLILGAQVLGRKIAPLAAEGATVGVLLPNTAGVAVTFFALQTIGRVPAMLNFTAGPGNIVSACKAAGVRVVLTSSAFIEKAHLEPVIAALQADGLTIVRLEDVRTTITFADKLAGIVLGSRPQAERTADEPAVVLFTSGSEGAPKGVVLSHRNILANAAQCLARVAANGEDKVFNPLPVFHAFGLTGGLMMPLVGGIPVFLYPSPLHYRIVPELVYGTNATILFGTDTFLAGYARSSHPYDMRSIRLVIAGAEPVKQRTRDVYMEKFGVRILEGYGVTETAPVLALNTPLANKVGTVGRLAPLIEAKLEPVTGIEEGGRLFVRGPNVMLGYYKIEKPGVLQPPVDGWHDTGDIVAIDSQGFVSIKGRAKRFAKVGGEMVSLAAIEAMAADIWTGAISVVVAVPDARKGERLVLVTTDTTANRDAILKAIKAQGRSELMLPAEVMIVDKVPLLGSGKPDFVATKALVEKRIAEKAGLAA